MRHKNGRRIVGVSHADIASGDRARCNVVPVLEELWGIPPTVKLVASGPGRGAPVKPEDLDAESRANYEEWLARRRD